MKLRISRDSQRALHRAVREIQVMAGIGQNPISERNAAGNGGRQTLVGVPVRRLKGIRGNAPSDAFRVDPTHLEPDHAIPPVPEPTRVSIGITSPHQNAGKTTLSMALASSLCSDFGVPVTLVDADVETNSVADVFGLTGRPGFAEAVTGESHALDVVNRSMRRPLGIMTAGLPLLDPGRLARSEHVKSVLDELKEESRFIVLDLPSTLDSGNAPDVAAQCDVVIVVVRGGDTSRRDLEKTLRMLRASNVAGVVINRSKSHVPRWVADSLNLAV